MQHADASKRPQLTDFHRHWHTLTMPLPARVLPQPHKPAAGLGIKSDMDDPIIEELKNLKERLPYLHWERISEKIRSTVHSNFTSEPVLLQNPKPLLSSKGRPTESQARIRAVTVARSSTSSELQRSSSSTKRIPSSWEMYEKGQENADCAGGLMLAMIAATVLKSLSTKQQEVSFSH